MKERVPRKDIHETKMGKRQDSKIRLAMAFAGLSGLLSFGVAKALPTPDEIRKATERPYFSTGITCQADQNIEEVNFKDSLTGYFEIRAGTTILDNRGNKTAILQNNTEASGSTVFQTGILRTGKEVMELQDDNGNMFFVEPDNIILDEKQTYERAITSNASSVFGLSPQGEWIFDENGRKVELAYGNAVALKKTRIQPQGFSINGLIKNEAYQILYMSPQGEIKTGYMYANSIKEYCQKAQEAQRDQNVLQNPEASIPNPSSGSLDMQSQVYTNEEQTQELSPQLEIKNIDNTIIAGSYGWPGKGIGTLGFYSKTEDMFFHTNNWASWVQRNFPEKEVLSAIFPVHNTTLEERNLQIINEARDRNKNGENWTVMLTFDFGTEEEITNKITQILESSQDNSHIGFVLDLEHFGRVISVSELNRIASYFAAERARLGYNSPGLFGVWYFTDAINGYQIVYDEPLRQIFTNPQTGKLELVSIPIFDGFGSAEEKWAGYDRMLANFNAQRGGMMGSTWRWGNNKYDKDTAEEVFNSNYTNERKVLIMAQQ